MKKFIVLSALAFVLTTLPAAAQSLTAFNDADATPSSMIESWG